MRVFCVPPIIFLTSFKKSSNIFSVKNFNYPKETHGSKLAAKVRAKANKLTLKQRQKLYQEATDRILGRISIDRITIVRTFHGPDTLMLWTDLPSSMPKVTSQNAIFKLDVEADRGEEYCSKYFPNIPVKVIMPFRQMNNER
jgi:hypothetical protein